MVDKRRLRARLLRQRDAADVHERRAIDRAICQRLCSLMEFQGAAVVLSYLSMGSEVETRGIIDAAWHAHKVVALPRVAGRQSLHWYRVDGPSELATLERSAFGVLEPAANPAREVVPDASALAVVPGLSFDHAGYRLGYGAGFYDVFLRTFPGSSVGLCRSGTLVDALRVIEPYDVPVQQVVTEREIVVPDAPPP